MENATFIDERIPLMSYEDKLRIKEKVEQEIAIDEQRNKHAELLKHLKADRDSTLDPKRTFSKFGNAEILNVLVYEMINQGLASEHFITEAEKARSPKGYQGAWTNMEGLRGGLELRNCNDVDFIELMRIWQQKNADDLHELLLDVIEKLDMKVAIGQNDADALNARCEESKASVVEKKTFKVKFKGKIL